LLRAKSKFSINGGFQMSEQQHTSVDSTLGSLSGMKPEDLEELEKSLKEAKEKSSEFIRAYPLTSLAIGVGLGFVFARLFLINRKS
jgi:ElaB/YqjD/DUF883 family membrane-anchored ribosome-binding protein